MARGNDRVSRQQIIFMQGFEMKLGHQVQIVAAAAAMWLGAAAPAAAQSTLNVVLHNDIRNVFPGMSSDNATGIVLQQVYEGLVAWRENGTVAPMLAKDIQVSDDKLSYTFTLRPDVKFHNGAPLTSKEVVWTWQQFLDPKRAWPCRTNFTGGVVKIEEVTAKDAQTVVFRLAAPAPIFLSLMARSDCDSTGIAHPDSINAEGAIVRGIGTGPFQITEWRRGEYVDLARFPAYVSRTEPADGLSGAKRAEVDKVRFVLIPDTNSQKLALQSGAVDIHYSFDARTADELKAMPGITVDASAIVSFYAFLMQTSDPILKDVRIRQAIVSAIDYDALRQGVMSYAKGGTSIVPISTPYYGPVQRQGQTYDLARTKRLLQEAGYRGQPITLTTNNNFALMYDTGVAVQAMLQAAGINAQLEVGEFGSQMSRYYSGRYQMLTWNSTPYLDPIFLIQRYIGPKATSPEKVWDNPKAVELINQLMNTTDVAARQPLFDALHRLFMEDAPMITWSSNVSVVAYRSRVHGFNAWSGHKPRLWNVSLR